MTAEPLELRAGKADLHGLRRLSLYEEMVEKQHEHHLSVSLEPLDDFLVIEPGDAETWTRSGLIVPAGVDQGCLTGIVTAVGPDANGIEPGDKVLFPKQAGYDVRLGAGTVKVLRREDLIARIID